MSIINILRSTVSQPITVEPNSIVTVRPLAGATVIVEYTTGSVADVINNVAVWAPWAKGSVTTTTQDLLNDRGLMRFTATGGNASVEIDDAPSAASLSAYIQDWGIGGGGGGSYNLPVATASVLGGVKQGANVTIAGDGTVSVAAPGVAVPETYTTLSASTVTTSATPTAGATVAPAAAACTGLFVQNGAVSVEYQRNATGAFYAIRPYAKKFIFGITDANQIGFRRTDFATARNTQTSPIQLQLINTSATYFVSNINVTTTSNATYTAFASLACASIEVKNTSDINVNLKINAGASAILLRRNETYLVSNITNANQVSAVSYSTSAAVTICAEAFQAAPGLDRGSYVIADVLSDNTRIFLGEPQAARDIFAMPSFFMPFTKYNQKGKTISLFRTVAETYTLGGTTADTSLAGAETYATYSPIAAFGAYTAITNTFNSGSTNTFTSAINTISPIDVNNCSIHATIQRIGTGGTVTGVFIDLFSTGLPSAPGADYHTIPIVLDINNGFANATAYGARSFGINRFSVVGAGANLSAITFARFRVTGTSGLVVRPGEIKAIKNASTKAAIAFTFDDNHATAMTRALPVLSAYAYPGILFPSPSATNTGNNNSSVGGLRLDAMLALQHKHAWQVGSQDFLREGAVDMTADEWLESQNKNFVFGAAIGFDGDGLRDASIYGGGSFFVTAEQTKIAQKIHASVRRFDGGMGSLGDGLTPFYFADTNPPGDPWNMRALNVSTWGSGAGTANNIYLKMKDYVDQAVACKGIAIFGMHTDWQSSEIDTALKQLTAYIQTLETAGTAEVLTLAQIRKRQAASA